VLVRIRGISRNNRSNCPGARSRGGGREKLGAVTGGGKSDLWRHESPEVGGRPRKRVKERELERHSPVGRKKSTGADGEETKIIWGGHL